MIQPFLVIRTRRTGSAKLINMVFTVIADVWMMELIWYTVTIKNVKSGFISAASTPKGKKWYFKNCQNSNGNS